MELLWQHDRLFYELEADRMMYWMCFAFSNMSFGILTEKAVTSQGSLLTCWETDIRAWKHWAARIRTHQNLEASHLLRFSLSCTDARFHWKTHGAVCGQFPASSPQIEFVAFVAVVTCRRKMFRKCSSDMRLKSTAPPTMRTCKCFLIFALIFSSFFYLIFVLISVLFPSKRQKCFYWINCWREAFRRTALPFWPSSAALERTSLKEGWSNSFNIDGTLGEASQRPQIPACFSHTTQIIGFDTI